MRFPESSIENLRGFGYSEDEARFLHGLSVQLSK